MIEAKQEQAAEQHRHECEVRYVMAMPTRQARAAYLDGLARWRTPDAIKRLRDDVMRAWLEQAWPRPPELDEPRGEGVSVASTPRDPDHPAEGGSFQPQPATR